MKEIKNIIKVLYIKDFLYYIYHMLKILLLTD